MSARVSAGFTSRPLPAKFKILHPGAGFPGAVLLRGVGFAFPGNKRHLSAMNVIAETAQSLREEFTWLDDWEARYAHLIDLGKANAPLGAGERTEAARVRGCASQVWVVTARDGETLRVRAESDALIVSGLIALLTRLYDGAPTREVATFDARALLDEIGVSGALTAQRSNGLAAMLDRIRSDAAAFQGDTGVNP
jgi:cysteine desulfuration protein SufE